MEHETHSDNDEHIIDIFNDDDFSSGSSPDVQSSSSPGSSPDVESSSSPGSSPDVESYSSARSSLCIDDETSDEGSSSSTSGCESRSLWNSIELVITLVQIVAAVVVFTLAKYEHPRALLLAWLIGYSCGCTIASILLILTWLLRKDSEDVEYPMTRKDRVMEHLKMGLDCFFVVWLVLGIVWICDGHSFSSDAPRLYRLCVAFIAFSCIRFTAAILLCQGEEGQRGGFVFQGPINDDDCCCICLGKYGEKEGGVIRKLDCSHVFHSECIDKWLRFKPSCPLCQSLVRR